MRNQGLLGLLGRYLTSTKCLALWGLFITVAAAYVVNIRLAVMMNEWNGRFFNALQAVNVDAIYDALFDFIWLASSIILLLVTAGYLKQRLILALRRDITFLFFNNWLSDFSAHYLLQQSGNEPDNPDQRITEDVRGLVTLSVNLFLSFLESVLTIGSFSVILWKLSGSLKVFGVTIEGYMFWVCLSYTIFATAITHLIGRKLKPLNIEVQHKEANLRASLMEKRRYADAIAGSQAESVERIRLQNRFDDLLDVLIRLVKKQRDLNFFTVGLGQITHLAPIFFALPSFFAGTLMLGGLMQIRGAFVDVARSFSWFIFAYDELALLAATYERLRRLHKGLQEGDARRESLLVTRASAKQEHSELQIQLPGSAKKVSADIHLTEGKLQVISGPSGIGKSTLLKSLAGFYECDQGAITVKPDLMWIPQKSYLFNGSLKDNLTYPKLSSEFTDTQCQEALRKFGLQAFCNRLHESQDWVLKLSGGEQQRICLIRAILNNPSTLLLDETISALDDESATSALNVLRQELPQTAIVLVSHQQIALEQADSIAQVKAIS